MAALPYIQLYVADYLADTAHLTTVEHGAYLLLIFNYWQKGESFKAKDERTLNKRLATVARMNEQEWENVKETLGEFFEIGENEWIHNRIERDLLAVNSKSNKAKAAGKASAQKRAVSKDIDNKDESNERSTDVQQTFNHTEADTYLNTDRDTDRESKSNANASTPTHSKKSPSPEQKKQKAKQAFDYTTIETPDFIDRALWLEWLTERKAQHPKSSQTETAIRSHLKTLVEIQELGMSANAALVIAIKGGADGCWIGIEVDWIRNRIQKSETRVAGYQPTAQANQPKPVIRDFEQERKDQAAAEAKQRLMERRAREATVVLSPSDYQVLQQQATG